jgi:hypothetical protein
MPPRTNLFSSAKVYPDYPWLPAFGPGWSDPRFPAAGPEWSESETDQRRIKWHGSRGRQREFTDAVGHFSLHAPATDHIILTVSANGYTPLRCYVDPVRVADDNDERICFMPPVRTFLVKLSRVKRLAPTSSPNAADLLPPNAGSALLPPLLPPSSSAPFLVNPYGH